MGIFLNMRVNTAAQLASEGKSAAHECGTDGARTEVAGQ